MTHVDRDTIALLALGEPVVDPEQRAHVDGCEDCRTLLAHLRETVTIARALEPDERAAPPAPPPAVWDAIAADLADDAGAADDERSMESTDMRGGEQSAEAGHVSHDEPFAQSTDVRGAEPPMHTTDDLRDDEPPARPTDVSEDAPPVRPTEAAAATVTPLAPRRGPGAWLAAAAAVVVLALVGAGLVAALREPSPTLLADTTLDPLADVQPTTARLVEASDGLRLELDVELADLPDTDGYYEVWLIDTGVSRLVSLGPLTPGEPYRLPANLDVAAYPVVDVSLEPFDGDPAHSGNSLLRGVLPLEEGAG